MKRPVKHLDIRVLGRVQGVFFRATTREAALALGVRGTVRNEPDGSVLIEAEGDDESLDRFLERVRQGPPGSRVVSLDIREGGPRGCSGFEIVG
ncbi:MAG: acylphosphatase [Candidatus Eiseniibacteriota bacterium]